MNKTDLTALIAHLSDSQASDLGDVITNLEAAVASGMVPNKLVTDAKFTINRAVEEGAEKFLATGPHTTVCSDGSIHHMSDWWRTAYHADAFVRGAHTLPTVLKRARKAHGLTEYAAFVATLVPLRDLLEAAKPLIKKRGELPKVMTEAQIADDAKRMTCQCCGRRIFAETGSIAHHGYERPGTGWQTQSCMGAKELPFEVSRDRLGDLIKMLKDMIADNEKHLANVKADRAKVTFAYRVRTGNYGWTDKSVGVTKAWFLADDVEGPAINRLDGHRHDTYATLKAREIADVESTLRILRLDLRDQQARYDGWKQTHNWGGDGWEKVA